MSSCNNCKLLLVDVTIAQYFLKLTSPMIISLIWHTWCLFTYHFKIVCVRQNSLNEIRVNFICDVDHYIILHFPVVKNQNNQFVFLLCCWKTKTLTFLFFKHITKLRVHYHKKMVLLFLLFELIIFYFHLHIPFSFTCRSCYCIYCSKFLP